MDALSIIFGILILLLVLTGIAFPVVGVLVQRKEVLYPIYGKDWWKFWKHWEEYRTYKCIDALGREVKLHIRDHITLDKKVGEIVITHIHKDGTIEWEKVKK